MDLITYYDLISREKKARRYLLEKCFKPIHDFVLDASHVSYKSYETKGTGAPAVSMRFMISPIDGEIMVV